MGGWSLKNTIAPLPVYLPCIGDLQLRTCLLMTDFISPYLLAYALYSGCACSPMLQVGMAMDWKRADAAACNSYEALGPAKLATLKHAGAITIAGAVRSTRLSVHVPTVSCFFLQLVNRRCPWACQTGQSLVSRQFAISAVDTASSK
jgi:hypothetical protein